MDPKALLHEMIAVAVPTQGTGNVGIGNTGFGRADYYVRAFNTTEVVNSETFDPGDAIVGDNSGTNANLRIDGAQLYLRQGTSNIMTMDASGIQTTRGIGLARTTITVGSGTLTIDDGTAGLMRYSRVRITASTGNFTVTGIATPVNDGHVLLLRNATANNMTIQNAGAPGAGYSQCITFTGADEV